MSAMTERPAKCPHERLDEEGYCRACGADNRDGKAWHSQPDVSPVSHTFPSQPDHVREVTEMVRGDAPMPERTPASWSRIDANVSEKDWKAAPSPRSRGEKRAIDRPCSACSAGDYEMEYHDHYPPFRDEAPRESQQEPAPPKTARELLVMIKELGRVTMASEDGREIILAAIDEVLSASSSPSPSAPQTEPSDRAEVSSEWRDGELWWMIDGENVSDKDLRSWCYRNIDWPYKFVDVIRQVHIDAWNQSHKAGREQMVAEVREQRSEEK